MPDGLQADEAEVGGVGLGPQLHAAHVPHAHQRAVARRPSPPRSRTVTGSVSRPSARTLRLNIWSSSAGASPSAPAATCRFCSRSAFTTSPAVMAAGGQAGGSSHRRIAYLRSPKMITLPTPGTRFSASRT